MSEPDPATLPERTWLDLPATGFGLDNLLLGIFSTPTQVRVRACGS